MVICVYLFGFIRVEIIFGLVMGEEDLFLVVVCIMSDVILYGSCCYSCGFLVFLLLNKGFVKIGKV